MKKAEEMTDEELFAELDRDNDSGFQTSDLVKLVRSASGPWSGPMTGEEFEAHLNALAAKYASKPETSE
jgi:hypothetical protein